jgi:peptidoglycan/xylan/chitin deacetylase (PgdA/CDA1 family)
MKTAKLLIEPAMKEMKKESSRDTILRPLINSIPFSIIRRIGLGEPVILYYHVVNDEDVPHISNLYKYKQTKQFVDDLEFLLKHYLPTRLSDVIDWTNGKYSLPHSCFLLTFDDGFKEISDVIAPILLEKGIPATFFISSAFLDNRELCYQHKTSLLVERILGGISAATEREIKRIMLSASISFSAVCEGLLRVNYKRKDVLDRIADVLQIDFQEYLREKRPYLSSCQVLELIDKGFAIGAHSIDHPYYSEISLQEQMEQTIVSVKQIREKFCLGYGAFAFPHNDTGVSSEFFKRVEETGLVDITFGTGGMLDVGPRTHKQRVSLEKPLLPAKSILKWHYARKGYNKIKRQYQKKG